MTLLRDLVAHATQNAYVHPPLANWRRGHVGQRFSDAPPEAFEASGSLLKRTTLRSQCAQQGAGRVRYVGTTACNPWSGESSVRRVSAGNGSFQPCSPPCCVIRNRFAQHEQGAALPNWALRSRWEYEALLSDPDVEAVYNPLPNHLHADWTIAAMRAGKHVLCEKPMTCTSDEILPIIKARDECGVYVEEAFMVRDHPQWQVVRELIDGGRIGTVRDVQMSYSHFSQDPDDIRFSVEAGGGSLMDVGCYCVAMMRFIFNGEPQRVMAATRSPGADAVDHVTTAMLEFEQGHGSFFCSIRASRSQLVQIVGDAGWIRLEVPFAHPETLSARI